MGGERVYGEGSWEGEKGVSGGGGGKRKNAVA